MPISTPIELVSDYGDDPDHFEHVLRYLFAPALERVGYDMTPPSVLNSQVIQAEIIRNLEMADLVLCDISGWNANVFFELGIRVALDRPVALVKDSRTSTIPFDNALVSCHTYDASITPWRLDEEIGELAEFVRSAGAQKRNALWQYFGITQRASVPASGDPVHEKLDLVLAALLQRPDPPWYNSPEPSVEAAGMRLLPPLDQLTPREYEILVLLATGESNARIARRLGLSEKTVRNQFSSVFSKLEVADRVQAALLARSMGVV